MTRLFEPEAMEGFGKLSLSHKELCLLPASQILILKNLLRKVEERGVLSRVLTDKCRKVLRKVQFISQNLYRSTQEKNDIFYTISLWDRDPRVGAQLNLPPWLSEDPASQVILMTPADGVAEESVILRLFQNREGRLCLFDNRVGRHAYQSFFCLRLHAQITKELKRIGEYFGVKLSQMHGIPPSLQQVEWWTHLAARPVSTPLEKDGILAGLNHPHASLFHWPKGSFEAFKKEDAKKTFLSRVVEKGFPLDLPFLVTSGIEHYPKMDEIQNYLWGFSGDMGRSADFYLGDQGYSTLLENGIKSSFEVKWYHLSGIGVGQTFKARNGLEKRDGKLPLNGALKRLYLTQLMNYVAGPLGLRTSLGISVCNKGIVRAGHENRVGVPQIEATLWELRREQLRLKDFENLLPEKRREALDLVKKKIALELNRSDLSDAEYIRWLAHTMGKQFALMEWFHFDHGVYEGQPQLHPGNFSLAGEVFDFDASHFVRKSVYRYLMANKSDQLNCLNLQNILHAQKKFLLYGEVGDWCLRAAACPYFLFSIFLEHLHHCFLAPQIGERLEKLYFLPLPERYLLLLQTTSVD